MSLLHATLFVLSTAVQDAPKPAEPKPPEAQQPTKKQAEDVIITGSPLNPTDLFHSPTSSDVVSGDDIRNRRQSRTLPEALEETPGVSVQKTGPGQGSPFIRGWTGYRNVLLVDGIRFNNSTFREGPNQYWGTVDPYLADRVELVRGPMSVLYGSDAIGGTVNVFTIEPDLSQAGTHFHSRTIGRFASAEQSYVARQEFSGNVDGFGWGVGGTYRDFGDIDGGKHYGEMNGTAYDQYSLDLKFVARLDEHSKLVLAAQHDRQSEAPRWHSTADSLSWHGTLPGTDRERDFNQERNLYYLQYHWESQGGVIDAIRASLSYQAQGESEDRTLANGNVEVREFEVDTPGAFLHLGKGTDLGYFTIGAEFYRDNVSSDAHNRSAAGVATDFERGPVADDSTYDWLGFFLQDEIRVGIVALTLGVRYSRMEVDAEQVDPIEGDAFVISSLSDTFDKVTGSARAVVSVEEHWNVIAGWGMGFRAPSLNDLTSFNVALSGVLDVPTEGLDPETFHTFDLGVRAKYATWEFSAFAFYTLIEDFVGRVPTAIPPGAPGGVTSAFAKDNVGDGYMYGYEIMALYRLTEEVAFFADWGYAKGEVDQISSVTDPSFIDEQPLGKIGPSILHVGSRWEPLNSGVWIEGVITCAARQSHLAFQEGLPGGAGDGQRIPAKHGTPGYTAYLLRGGYQVNQHLHVTGAVENISNKDYRVHGSGVNEPGTNFVLGLDLRF